jgi:hypothetical protein
VGTNPGEYAATEEYNTALAAVEAIDAPAVPTTQDEVNSYAVSTELSEKIAAVNAITLEQNLPQTGHYIRIKTAPVWANTTFGGTQPYLSTGNKSSRAAFVDDADANTIFYYGVNSDNKKTLCCYNNGLYLYDNQATDPHLINSTSAASNNAIDVDFTDATTYEMSTYFFLFHNGTRQGYTNANKYSDAGKSGNTDAGYRFQVEYVNELPLNLSGGVTTFDVPVAVSLPAELNGAKVFTMSLSGTVLNLTEVTSSTGTTFPAGTAFVITGGNGTVNFPIDYTATDAANAGVAANVNASVFAEQNDGTKSFIQGIAATASDDDAEEATAANVTITFTALSAGATIPANAVIVNLPESDNTASTNGSFSLAVADGIQYDTATDKTTGIDAVVIAPETGSAVVYDLQGRRVRPNAHGIYIVNGKKIKM